MRSQSDITVLSSDDFWERVSGIRDFRARLLRTTTILAWLVKAPVGGADARIKQEAVELFADAEGRLDLEALARAPMTAREERAARATREADDS